MALIQTGTGVVLIALGGLGLLDSPTVNWILLGVGLALFGTGIVALRRRRGKGASVPAPVGSERRVRPRASPIHTGLRPTAIRLRKGADDAMIQDSVFSGDMNAIDNEGAKRMHSIRNQFNLAWRHPGPAKRRRKNR
jgi:hypothetical protein